MITSRDRWFLPLMAITGLAMSLTAPLEVLFAHEFWGNGAFIATFMLSAAIGVITIDVFGTRFVPGLNARTALVAGLATFGLACVGMGVASGEALMLASRVLQGFGGGLVLGAGLQAAVRVRSVTAESTADLVRALARFNAAFLFGGAVGAPGGLLVAALVDGRTGYQVALVCTGGLAVAVAVLFTVTLPPLPAPMGTGPARIGLPQLTGAPGARSALLLAMGADFLRGGVLFTALPLAGAARDHPTIVITAAIAVMSGVEIVMLASADRIIRRFGVFAVLVASFALGVLCALLVALADGAPIYLVASALFGVSLAGATAGLPVVVVTQVGESSAGLAKFRISAGIGALIGMVGCAVLADQLGVPVLFLIIAGLLLVATRLTYTVERQMAAT